MDIEYIAHALEVYKGFILKHFPEAAVDFIETPKHADFDRYVYINDKFSHHIEVKKRNNVLNRYEETKVPLRKHSTAEHYFLAKGIKTYFVCEFDDCVAYLKLWEEPDNVETMVARHDRGEDEDISALYNVSRFIKIS